MDFTIINQYRQKNIRAYYNLIRMFNVASDLRYNVAFNVVNESCLQDLSKEKHVLNAVISAV